MIYIFFLSRWTRRTFRPTVPQKVSALRRNSRQICHFDDLRYHCFYAPITEWHSGEGLKLKCLLIDYNIAIVSPSPDTVSQKLRNSNIYTIAKRNVEGQDMLYQSLQLTNGIKVLAELKIQPGMTSFTVSVCLCAFLWLSC